MDAHPPALVQVQLRSPLQAVCLRVLRLLMWPYEAPFLVRPDRLPLGKGLCVCVCVQGLSGEEGGLQPTLLSAVLAHNAAAVEPVTPKRGTGPVAADSESAGRQLERGGGTSLSGTSSSTAALRGSGWPGYHFNVHCSPGLPTSSPRHHADGGDGMEP